MTGVQMLTCPRTWSSYLEIKPPYIVLTSHGACCTVYCIAYCTRVYCTMYSVQKLLSNYFLFCSKKYPLDNWLSIGEDVWRRFIQWVTRALTSPEIFKKSTISMLKKYCLCHSSALITKDDEWSSVGRGNLKVPNIFQKNMLCNPFINIRNNFHNIIRL